MTEEQRKQVAVFRFGVIHELTGSTRLDHGEREALLREKCARKWEIPFSTRTRISRSTIERWVSVYLASAGKLEALYPKGRADAGQPRSIDEETGLALLALRREQPKLAVAELLRLLHTRQGGTGPAQGPSLSTAYRFLHHHDLMATPSPAPEDRRKFEAELPNDLWQSDVMHGPLVLVGEKRRKSYLIAFLDDHSRLIPRGVLPLRGPRVVLGRLFPGAAQTGSSPKALRGQRLGLPLPPARVHLGRSRHRARARPAVPPPGKGENRAVFQNRPDPVPAQRHRFVPRGAQPRLRALAHRRLPPAPPHLDRTKPL